MFKYQNYSNKGIEKKYFQEPIHTSLYLSLFTISYYKPENKTFSLPARLPNESLTYFHWKTYKMLKSS